MTERAIVAEFFRSATGITRLHALTVIEELVDRRDGHTYFSRKYYDVEWSRVNGYYLFHNSGGGGGKEPIEVQGLFFTSGDVDVDRQPTAWCSNHYRSSQVDAQTRRIRRRNPTRRMMCLPGHVELEPGQDLLDWLNQNHVEQDAVWCSECHDWVRGDELCRHSWWCDKIGWYSTPSERCDCANREECGS